jgi:hypothetical protein
VCSVLHVEVPPPLTISSVSLQVGSGGIVRDPAVHQDVLSRIIAGVKAFGFDCVGHMQSPIKGTEGNVEFLGVFRRQSSSPDVQSQQEDNTRVSFDSPIHVERT